MCRQCELRKINDDDDLEASALLQMLMNKMHARPVEDDGAMQIAINLSGQEADWLCAWGASNEDMEDCDPAEEDDAAEDSDPAEEDAPPEASEQLDTDCRIEAYRPIELKQTRRIKKA